MRPSLAIAFLALLSCGAATEPGPPPGALRVLFIGNSLTYTNDLPKMVKTIAAADGVELYTKTYASPNYGLQDHWEDGVVPDEIAAEKWDVVVMQQGPSSQESSRIDLLYWSIKFDQLADLHHTCVALYMVWPDAAHKALFNAVHDHYQEAADTTGGQFFPAGRAWELAWLSDGTIPFYGPDGFHPSPLGTYAAALVIAGGLTGKDPTVNTAQVSGVPSGGAAWATTRQAAKNALAGVPRRCVE